MTPINSSSSAQQHLTVVIDDFRKAMREMRIVEAEKIMSRYPLHIFYHLEVSELTEALEAFEVRSPFEDENVTALSFLLHANPESAYLAPEMSPDAHASFVVQLAYMIGLRLRGRHREAYEFMLLKLLARRESMYPMVDLSGWSHFGALQNGLTAMLMGKLDRALGALEEVWWRTSIPGLEIITREALSKAALVHATFGDPLTAKKLVSRCKAIESTSSWAEQQVEVALAIVEAMLCLDAEESRNRLGNIELSHLGEIWPFYVQAEYRALDSLGVFAYATSRLAQLDSLPFPFTRGEGYSGSVFPLMMALNGIAAGDPSLVRRHLDDCDRNLALTGIVEALLSLQVGAIPDAITKALRLRNSTRFLRRLELWRLSILGDAYIADDNQSAAVRALRETMILPDPLSSVEVTFFSNELRELGETHVTGWPKGESKEEAYMDYLPRRANQLSDREIEVLRSLLLYSSRRDLAEALYVSPNTIKTQLRSIYKKLGVGSREEAIHEAALRGLI